MNERVKILRKSLGLSGEKFGQKLGVQKTAVSKIERGENKLTEQMIKSICREFNVNEDWIRNGTEPMYIELSRDEQIAGFIGSVLSTEKETFKKRLIRVLSQLNEDEWEFLEQKARELVGYEAEKES